MPAKLSNILANTAHTEISFLGEVITLTYKPGVVTKEWVAKTNEALVSTDADEAVLLLATALSQAIVRWDLYETWDDQTNTGSLYPITPEKLSALAVPLLGALLQGIKSDLNPNSQGPSTKIQNIERLGGGSFSVD